jgi:TP901 family phage tail tape measure protein
MAKNEIKILINAQDNASKAFGKIGKSLKNMAAGVSAVAIGGLAAGLTVSVMRAEEFEHSMARVGALSGASAKQLEDMTAAALKMGQTTAFTAKEAAEGMQFLAMAGFDVEDALDALPGLLSTASAGQMDLGQTSDIVSNILSGFNIKAEETGKVADVLAKTFTSSNTDLSMLGESMKYVAPIASDLGFTLEETAAAVGTLGNAGIQGSMAGTSLKAILSELAAPSSAAKELMEELGIAVADSSGEMLPFGDILQNMQEGLEGVIRHTENSGA